MAATKTSLAWQEFRHSNLVSTSATVQERDDNDYSDDSDGAEGDGFVEADSNATQMMVEIMDKYVQAGEALAEKENDMRQLMKQVEELKRQKSDLENRTSQLTEANEKLADSEGRWYSLAMELEDQMGVIKKGETYTLFQDKVDEAEARLEVATEANNTNKKRLHEIYGLLSDSSGPSSSSTGEGPVDEHHLQATILAQLRHLKSSLKDVEDARTITQIDHEAEVEKMKNQAQAEEDARASIQKELEKLYEEAERRDAAYMSQVGELQETLQGVKISCSEAEARAEAMDEARAKALENLDAVAADLELEREESRGLQETITRTRADLASSQQEINEVMQLKQRAQESAEANAHQSAKRLAELETRLQEERDSRQHASDLLERYRSEVHSAKAHEAAQESQLMDSSKRVDELEHAIRVVRSQLGEVQHNADENERLAAERQNAVEELRQELKIAQAEASAGQQFAAQVNALRLELGKANAEVDALRLELKRAAEEAEEQRLKLMKANTEVTAAREQALQQTRELSEELERAHQAATVDIQRQSAHALSLEQELDNVKKGFATAELRHAAELENLRRELQVTRVQAEDARQRHHIEIEKMHKASTSAASSAQKAAVRVEELLRELSRVSETAHERAESVTLLRQELNDAQAAILAAQKEAKYSRDARLEAEGAFSVALTKKEEALREQDARLREVKQALEKSVQQTQKLSQNMRNLEARLDEATSHEKEAEMEGKRLRTALEESEGKVADLGRSLMATRVELDGKTEEVAKLIEESLTNAASSSTEESKRGTNVLHGPQTVDLDHHTSNGGAVSSTVVANGHSSHGAELEQLQAQAEAMELELRCTIESFDGQLNAMAREKLAIQKQVKELTGQCTTLRKQVSHYKKQAKESEAHVEQIVELQHQLCATEATAGSLRDTNNELKSRIDLLEADKNEVSRLRARLDEAEKLCKAKQEELAAKTQDAEAVIARSIELKRQVGEVKSELSSAKASFAAMETELGTGRTRISELEELVGKMKGDKQRLKDFADARRSEAEEARSKLQEAEESVRSLRQEKDKLVSATQRADEEQAILVQQLREIETLTFSGHNEGSTVMEGITALKERVTTTDNLLQETAKALCLGGNGKFNPEEGTKRIINDIRTLQSRLQMAESDLRDSTEAQEKAGCVLKALKELSSTLECDGDMVIHKVAELKKLTLDLFQQRDVNLKEIQSLKDEALRSTRDVVTTTRQDSVNGHSTGDGNGQVSKVLSDIQAMLGCKMEEVMATLEEQQALVQQQHVTGKVLGEIMQSYLYNMDRLASFIAPEDYSGVCSLLAKASDVWSQGIFVNTTREGLDLVDEVTKMLTDIIPGALAESAAYQSALHRAGEEVERLKETMRKERLMMTVFRRWGHFYLAVSNEALRKRTKDRNHARTQRGIAASSQTCDMSPPDGLVSKRKPVKLPQTILQAVLDQEYLKATRELASQPPTSLLVLSTARQEMDTMARKMQDTLGSLMSQPPPTFHDTEDVEELTQSGQQHVEELTQSGQQHVEELTQSGQQHVEEPAQSGQQHVEELTQSGQQHVEEPAQSGQHAVEEPTQSGQHAVEEPTQSGQHAVEEPTQSGQQHVAGPAPRDGSDVMSQQGITVAKAGRQTTGPLVEDGISKEERARFLREQREQRKANRRKMNKNINRPNPPVTDEKKTAPRDVILPTPPAPTVTEQEKATAAEHDSIRASSMPPTVTGAKEELTRTAEKEPTPSENGQGTPVEESTASMVKNDASSSSTDVTTRPAVTAPPPRMFNPVNAAPPTGPPPRAAITTVSPTQRHPTMAFSVNETVEKALTEAKREASLADRRAMFWLRRFRDLAVLTASFTILSFSSDRSFDDC